MREPGEHISATAHLTQEVGLPDTKVKGYCQSHCMGHEVDENAMVPLTQPRTPPNHHRPPHGPRPFTLCKLEKQRTYLLVDSISMLAALEAILPSDRMSTNLLKARGHLKCWMGGVDSPVERARSTGSFHRASADSVIYPCLVCPWRVYSSFWTFFP